MLNVAVVNSTYSTRTNSINLTLIYTCTRQNLVLYPPVICVSYLRSKLEQGNVIIR